MLVGTLQTCTLFACIVIVFIAGRAAAASPVTVLAVVIAAAAAAEREGGGRLGVAVAEVGDAVLWMPDVDDASSSVVVI